MDAVICSQVLRPGFLPHPSILAKFQLRTPPWDRAVKALLPAWLKVSAFSFP